jgi:hypothetical protein
MDIAALVAWLVTALGGFVLLGRWLQGGGHKPGASRLPAPAVFAHFLLAAAGLVLWIVYLLTDADALAWVAFVALVLIASLGLGLFARWLPGRGTSSAGSADGRLPFPVVAVHGVVAVATVVLVLLTALGVGAS